MAITSDPPAPSPSLEPRAICAVPGAREKVKAKRKKGIGRRPVSQRREKLKLEPRALPHPPAFPNYLCGKHNTPI